MKSTSLIWKLIFDRPNLLPTILSFSFICAFSLSTIKGTSAAVTRGTRTIAYRGPDFREGVTCPPTSNGQFSHPKYCDKFLNCWEGELVIGQCSNGLVFNQNTSACDYPRNVDCSGREDSRPPLPASVECEKPYGTFASRTNCSQFIVCQGGEGAVYSCPHGLFYHEGLGVCTYKDDSNCVEIEQPNSGSTSQSTVSSIATSTVPSVSTSVPIITPLPTNPNLPAATVQPADTPSSPAPEHPGENEPSTTASSSLPLEPPSDIDHILWPAWPNWPTMKCPIVQGFLPVVGDCETVVVCLGGLGHFFRCPSGHAFDLTTGKCGPIRVTEGCQHHQFPDDINKRTPFHETATFNGKVKYVYLPVNVALMHQKGNNLNV